MSIIISKSDYDRYENQLKQYVKQILKNINIVILDATAIDVVKSLNIKYAFSSKYTLHQMPIPTPVTPQYTGIEWNLTPDRLFYLEVEPLVREFQGYIAMDLYDKPICVLDTGINENHRIFRDNMNIIEKLSVVGDDGSDKDGHSTHVSGIIATLVPYSKIVSIKIFRDGECTTAELLAGLDLAVQKNCAVVNMSLGGYPSKEEIDIVEPVLKQLRDQGIIAVVASGNESQVTQISYPASSDNVISVGAVTLLLMRAYYSNVDITNQKPHFTAFGDNILSASNVDNENYVSKSGTSMATPIVSAIAYYLYYFYDYIKQYNIRTPVVVVNTTIDPREPTFEAIFNSLKQLALQNNPFGTWNTSVSWGIVSFRKLSWFDIWGISFRAVKPPLLYPPASLPRLAEEYPKLFEDLIKKIIEKFLSENNITGINQIIQILPERVETILKLVETVRTEITAKSRTETTRWWIQDTTNVKEYYERKFSTYGYIFAHFYLKASSPVTVYIDDIVYENVTEISDVIVFTRPFDEHVLKIYGNASVSYTISLIVV